MILRVWVDSDGDSLKDIVKIISKGGASGKNLLVDRTET